jgi:asparagine synthase (glutamine-hydrolysing)
VDLDGRSDQPFIKNKYYLTFHGEIYNFRELRLELIKAGCRFRTNSDTEVLLTAFSKWGVSSLARLRGGYAFILVDVRNGRLYIIRDPIGEKHVVYTRASNGDWVFASEIKSLLTHPHVSSNPNLRQFASDLVFKFFSDREETHFQDIFFVPPGHYMWFDLHKGSGPHLEQHWFMNPTDTDQHAPQSVSELVEVIADLLQQSVRLCLQADRSVGSILSGGLDSSIVTYLAATDGPRDKVLNSFSIKYNHGANRDLRYAKLLAQTGSIKLHEVTIDDSLGLDRIDHITQAIEEPMWDKVYFAQQANYDSARKAGLRAVLNGQGADELWLGYLYFYGVFRLDPREITLARLITWWERNSTFVELMPPEVVRSLVRPSVERNVIKNFAPFGHLEPLSALTCFSIRTHLQSMLIQEDRLSMASGVEVRLPHVDIRLVECALSIPAHLKKMDNREKYLLRKVARRWLPQQIVNRRKLGFPEPPGPYDRQLARMSRTESLVGRHILGELFHGSVKASNKLTPREQWMLFAIGRMEKIFFS